MQNALAIEIANAAARLVVEDGLEWGAAKAHVHRRRHGAHPGFPDSGG